MNTRTQLLYSDIHSLDLGLSALRLMRGTDASYLHITNRQDDFINYPAVKFFMIDESSYGAQREFTMSAFVDIHLTGAHWGLDGLGDNAGVPLYLYRINSNGNLRWGLSRTSALDTLINGFSSTPILVTSKSMMLVNDSSGMATSDFCENIGLITADFTDSIDDWSISTTVGKNRVFPSLAVSNIYYDLVPPGIINPYAGLVAPSGWLLCDGSQVSRTTYANLFSIISTFYGNGDGSSTFHLPDFRGRFLRGVDGIAGRDPDSASRTAMNFGGNSGNNIGSIQGQATAKNGLVNSSSSVTGSYSSSVTGTVGGSDGSHTHGTTEVAHSHTFSASAVGSAQSQWTTYNVLGDAGASAWFDDIGTVPPAYNLTSRTINAASTGLSVNNTGSTHGHTFSLSTSGSITSGLAAAQTITGDSETRPINAYVNYIIKV